MWFNIIGAILGFIGSVIFSAGLLKPKEQIFDENNTYFDSNPFTTSGEMSSQPYYALAFWLIITGFAVTLGGQLGQVYKDGDSLVSVLFVLVIALVGYLLMVLLYLYKIIAHKSKRTVWLKGIFYNAVRTYCNDMRGIIGSPDEDEKFKKMKEVYQKDLLEKFKQVPQGDDKKEHLLIQGTSPTSTPQQFVDVAEKFLNENDV